MYLIKNIQFTDFGTAVKVVDGIAVAQVGRELMAFNEYWGKTNINVEKYADCSKFGRTDKENVFMLSYVSTVMVNDIGDGFKEFCFDVSTYQSDNKVEYIVFIEHIVGDIKTNGKKLFGRYSNEIVAILKEGEYIEFAGRRVEVINNKMMLII